MTRLDQDEDEIEASRAPLMDHLIELRSRLVVCVAAFLLGFIGCFIVADPIYVFLVQPFAVAAQFREAAGPGGPVSPFDLILGTAGLVPVPQLKPVGHWFAWIALGLLLVGVLLRRI